ncbi:MAG TPA: polysaccharide biosynthesis protein [Candidatus Obscuribacterales bacterium]
MSNSESLMLAGKNVVVFGGTGSLGKLLVRRILSGEMGRPTKVVVVSRDEAKQHYMRLEFQRLAASTDDIAYHDSGRALKFAIGDIRDYSSVRTALRDAQIVFNAAAMKQVPACEYYPFEAVQTNIIGAENIARAIRENKLEVSTVVGISTDKACKPVNVMGMTKAIQERVYGHANLDCPLTRFVCVRYGNVLASRGSVIPLFHDQIARGGPITITTQAMTRFLLSLDDAVDTIFASLTNGKRGEVFVPILPSARIVDLAEVLIGKRNIKLEFVGIRPGEKEHEVLISEEEAYRTERRGNYYVVLPILPELRETHCGPFPLAGMEYSSAKDVMDKLAVYDLLMRNNLLIGSPAPPVGQHAHQESSV